MAGPLVRVDGLRQLQRDLRATAGKVGGRELRAANKKAAEPVKEEGRIRVPKRTGRLERSITVQASQRSAYVKAGSKVRVPYAGVIHFGSPTRNIVAQPFLFDALEARQQDVIDTYREMVNDLLRKHFPTSHRAV